MTANEARAELMVEIYQNDGFIMFSGEVFCEIDGEFEGKYDFEPNQPFWDLWTQHKELLIAQGVYVYKSPSGWKGVCNPKWD